MSYWKEIRDDYMEEDDPNGWTFISIDAFKTEDDSEEGIVIAKVFGKDLGYETIIHVDYLDHIARTDQLAQETIEEAKKKMTTHLKENKSAWLYDGGAETIRLNIDPEKLSHYQKEYEKKNGQVKNFKEWLEGKGITIDSFQRPKERFIRS